ncbi:MAG: spermidine/putrescine ABC transporter substrate-binding protein [Thiotrichaceae bacterium]|nr:spermidine/putrescine ABC transporter substrate-binding protein [Thiotrichaceae bacterium]
MFKQISLFILLFFVFYGNVFAEDAEEVKELIFYNWTAYIDEDTIKEFEQKFNAKVKQAYFQFPEQRDETMLRKKGKGYDVILLSGTYVETYYNRGWLLELGKEKVPNLQHVDERWLNYWPKTENYAVPYLWGTTGIIYRSDMVKEEITSWKQFYQPAEYLKGKIMVLNLHQAAIGLALKSLGYSFNSENMKELKEVQTLLLAQKPYVQVYGVFKTDAESGIVTGDTWMGQTWNGDALLLQEQEPTLRYVVPKEGGEIWADYLVVSSQSKQPELAVQFVNFLQEPENNARCAEELAFAATNTKAKQFLSAEHLNNPIIYPAQDILDKSEVERVPSPRVSRKLVMIWSKLIANK